MIHSRRARFSRDSISWPIAGQGFFSVVNFVASILFARLTGPEVLGSYVFALTVVASVSVAVDICVQSALLTATTWDDPEAFIWSVLSIAVAASAGLVVFMVISLTVIGTDERQVGWLLLLSAMPLQAATQVPRARMVLNGDQFTLAVVDLVAAAGAVIAAMAALSVERSFVSLCVFTPVVALIRCTLMARFHPCPVHLDGQQWWSSINSIRQAMRGFYPLQLSSFVSRNIDNLVIGLILGPISLAFYSRAYGLFMGPLIQTQVALNPLSIAQIARDRRTFRLFGLRLSALVFPIVVFVLFRGRELVFILLGDGWAEVSGLLPAFMFAAALLTFSQPCRWLLQSGRHHKRMNVDAAMQLLLVVAAATGAWLGDVQTAAWMVGFAAAPIVCTSEWLLVWKMDVREDFLVLLSFALGSGLTAAIVEWLILQLHKANDFGVIAGAFGAIAVVLGSLALTGSADRMGHTRKGKQEELVSHHAS